MWKPSTAIQLKVASRDQCKKRPRPGQTQPSQFSFSSRTRTQHSGKLRWRNSSATVKCMCTPMDLSVGRRLKEMPQFLVKLCYLLVQTHRNNYNLSELNYFVKTFFLALLLQLSVNGESCAHVTLFVSQVG